MFLFIWFIFFMIVGLIINFSCMWLDSIDFEIPKKYWLLSFIPHLSWILFLFDNNLKRKEY